MVAILEGFCELLGCSVCLHVDERWGQVVETSLYLLGLEGMT